MLALLAVLAAPVQAQEEQAEPKDFRGYIDQAKFFIRRAWYDDALRELEASVELPDGRLDPEAWYMLATVRFELGELEGARHAAERAHSYSRDDQQLQVAAEYSAFLREQFGVVEVHGPYAGLTSRLTIELDSVLFDPALKRYLETVRDQSRKKLMLPLRVGLPAGAYLINGEPVVVGSQAEVVLVLDSAHLGTRGSAATQLAQAEVALGMSAWLGDSVRNLLPTVCTQVAYSQPVGPLVGGLMFDWAPQLFETTPGSVSYSPIAWSLGGRLGFQVPRTQPLVVRPSVGYRYGYVPGIELPCGIDGDGYRCGAGQPSELLVFAVGRAHIPMVELSVDYLNRKRTTTMGFGVKAVLEQAIGTLPREADAHVIGGSSVRYAVEGPRSWSAVGFRTLANVSLAF